jgi:hypothetical protein
MGLGIVYRIQNCKHSILTLQNRKNGVIGRSVDSYDSSVCKIRRLQNCRRIPYSDFAPQRFWGHLVSWSMEWLSDICVKRPLSECNLREVGLRVREREREKERWLHWQPILT